jgi:protein-tyrosine phosphatase
MTNLPILESYWVEENRLLVGEYPGSYNDETTRQKIDTFIEAGINTFIDLTQPHELPSYEAILKEQGRIYDVKTRYHRFAIRDHTVPARETMTSILNTIDEALKGGHGVYVHCWGGVGRTGIVVGCYLVRRGHSNKGALALVNTLYKTRPNNIYLPRSPETNEQINFILNWREE